MTGTPLERARAAGHALPDVFDDICRMLREGEPFAFSRFGDGEFDAIFGREGANCDGHRYFPDLGERLRAIVASRPPYLMGLQPLAIHRHGQRIFDLAVGVDWVFAGCLHDASIDGRLGRLLAALEGRRVLLAGPRHLDALAAAHGWERIPVASTDCWLEHDEVHAALSRRLAEGDAVVLLCASMMSNVLLDELHRATPHATYVDAGSVLDPYAGVKSRTYHHALDVTAIRTGADDVPGTL